MDRNQQHPIGLVLLGMIAGIVAFVGCFVNFFEGGVTGNIVNQGGGNVSFWFYFAPILLGLATLALLVPRATVAAIFPIGAVGLALGLKGSIDSIDFGDLTRQINRVTGSSGGTVPLKLINRAIHSGFGPGPGFFMIVIGGSVLALVWARIVHDMVVARFGSITEIIAIRTGPSGAQAPAPPSPGADVPRAEPAPTATPDPASATAPDPGPAPG